MLTGKNRIIDIDETSGLLEKSHGQVDPIKIKTLVDTALGRAKADLVITNADLVNVYSGELLEGQSVAVKGDRIAYVGEKAEHAIGPDTTVIDATEKVLIPGLIEAHTHLLSLYQVDEFLKYSMSGGTTTVITETSNLVLPLGYRGIREFLKATSNQPVKIFATVSLAHSLSPASRLNALRPEKLRSLLKQKAIVGLGETSWSSILHDEGNIIALHAEALNADKHLEGHSAGASGNNLVAFVASGISSCHEPITVKEVVDRLRLGLHVMVREGYIRKDLEAIAGIKDEPISFRRLVLCTDGVPPKHLMEHGHMDFVLQKAIDLGFDPIAAIQMATINAAELFSLDNITGGIAPGKCADMVVLPNLKTIQAEMVISNGQVVARQGQVIVPPRKHVFVKTALESVHIRGKITPADFRVRVQDGDKPVTVRVISLVTEAVTREEQMTVNPKNGFLEADIDRDILKVAFIDRKSNRKKIFTGFIKGIGMKRGAYASSVSMGLPGITVVGTTDEDMAGAVNRVIALQGGNVVYDEGEVLAELPLPIAGFASHLPLESIVQECEKVQRSANRLGTSLPDIYSTVGTLSTTVIPFLRICETGLMDVKQGELVSLIVS